jgi:hypothetical protein
MNFAVSCRRWTPLTLFALLAGIVNSLAADEPGPHVSKTLVLAHYMPWFDAKPVSQQWGWHWTMGAFDPEKVIDGMPQVASHYRPLIGPYDSSDVAVLEYHLLTMKIAGIDGVIVDWYGLTDFRDYAALHRNTTRLLETAERLQMKFAICYEDQTIPALVEAKRIKQEDRVSHAASEIQWLGKYWFQSPSYVSLDGKPLLLSFGQAGLTDVEWSQCLEQARTPVTYFSQHHRRTAAVGGFDWPVPSDARNALERFRKDAQNWSHAIPVAFPRFVDIYAEAKVGRGYGRVDDDKGKSFRLMLEHGLSSKAPIIQLATWNDWGEGTQIEPSIEFGYRDLETIRHLRIRSSHATTTDDLKLPLALFRKRKAKGLTETETNQLNEVVQLLSNGQLTEAKSLLLPNR